MFEKEIFLRKMFSVNYKLKIKYLQKKSTPMNKRIIKRENLLHHTWYVFNFVFICFIKPEVTKEIHIL